MKYRRCAPLHEVSAHQANDRPLRVLGAQNVQLLLVPQMQGVIFTNNAGDRKNPLLG